MHTTIHRIAELFLYYLDLPCEIKYLILSFAGLAKVGHKFSEFVIFS